MTQSSYESCHTFTTAYKTQTKGKGKVYNTSSPTLLLQYSNILFLKQQFNEWTKDEQLKQLNLEVNWLLGVQDTVERALDKKPINETLLKAQQNLVEGLDNPIWHSVQTKHNLGRTTLSATQQNTPSLFTLPLPSLQRQESYREPLLKDSSSEPELPTFTSEELTRQ